MVFKSRFVRQLTLWLPCFAAFKTSDPETDTLKAQILFCMIQGLGITYALYKLNGEQRAKHCWSISLDVGVFRMSRCTRGRRSSQ